ncbi:MAG: hypothetical protein AAF638_12915, partial [Pseudomonadota bacterium]
IEQTRQQVDGLDDVVGRFRLKPGSGGARPAMRPAAGQAAAPSGGDARALQSAIATGMGATRTPAPKPAPKPAAAPSVAMAGNTALDMLNAEVDDWDEF